MTKVTNRLAGTQDMVRLALRRDRWLLPVWIIGFALMAGISASATVGLYPDEAERVQAALTVNNTTALVALYGTIYDPTSVGALAMFKMTALGAATISVLMVFLVIRHTRAEEEAGRLELLRSAPLGAWAPLTAAYLVAFGASLVIGLASSAALIIAGLPVTGSLAFGLGWACSGIAFAALAGVVAQVTPNSRAARGLGLLAIALAYLVRAVADIAEGDSWLSWLSPIGWMQQVRAYAGDRWWVLLLPITMAVICVPLAFVLQSRRDLGAGLVQERPGPAQGNMSSSFALAWRLQRGSLIAWTIGFVFFGFLLGSLADSLTGFLQSPRAAELIQQLGGTQALSDAFLAMEISLAGIIVAAYGISAAARMRTEETEGHAELLLSTPTSRLRWAAGHVSIALAGVLVIMLLTGLAMGISSAAATGHWGQIGSMLVAAMARVPAAWVFTALTILVFGWLPQWVAGVWALFLVAVVLAELGPLWNAPQWLIDVSPFVHSPMLPGADVSTTGAWPLLAVAVALAAVGLWRWRERDLRP